MSPGNDGRAPRQESPPNVITTATDTPIVATDRRVYRRQHWAFPFINRAQGPIPLYGSDEWLALADNDPAKVASVVRAAETWALAGDTLEADLRAEVEESRRAFKLAEDAAYRARRDAHRKEWKHLSVVRSFPWNERQASTPDGAA